MFCLKDWWPWPPGLSLSTPLVSGKNTGQTEVHKQHRATRRVKVTYTNSSGPSAPSSGGIHVNDLLVDPAGYQATRVSSGPSHSTVRTGWESTMTSTYWPTTMLVDFRLPCIRSPRTPSAAFTVTIHKPTDQLIYELIWSDSEQLDTDSISFMAWRSGNALCPINEIALRRAGLVPVGDCLRTGKPSRYATSRLGQLSLLSLRGK